MLSKLTKNFKKGGKGNTSATCKKDHFKLAFKTGNIVQLFSRITGSTLQVTECKSLDGLGSKDSEASNTLWTVNVIDEHTIQLQQEESFLSIVDGEAKLVNKDELSGDESKLKISFFEQFVLLEAENGCGHHIGILDNGALKSAIATGTENCSHFAVKLIFTYIKPEEKKEEVVEEKCKENGETASPAENEAKEGCEKADNETEGCEKADEVKEEGDKDASAESDKKEECEQPPSTENEVKEESAAVTSE